ncbi:MAG TPA: DUF1289 domain-containing protein [Sphingomonas sp.]|nr:DUF1289 domain-containing protein [Sphingomonas sp.]
MDDFIERVPPRALASPCVNVCRIDPATRRCRGCARTIDEIARWTTLAEADRARIMAELPGRKRTA